MHILIVGCGALGGLVGAKLTDAGEKVTLLEINRARSKLLTDTGLYLAEGLHGERCIRINVVSSTTGMDPVDLVFIAVKSYQTEAAMRSVLSVIRPDTWVLSMQNGVGNTDVMAEIHDRERILCGITYHSIEHVGPNRLRYRGGIKPIQIAPLTGKISDEVREIGNRFNRAGLSTVVVEDIDHALWQKLLHNAVVNPVSALTGLTCNELLADEDLQEFMHGVCLEAVAVMKARGVPIVDAENPYRPVIGSQMALGKNRPSMWQDLSRGLRPEIEAINGAIVREAQRLGLEVPLNWGLVRFIRSRARQVLRRQGKSAEGSKPITRSPGERTPVLPMAEQAGARPVFGGVDVGTHCVKTVLVNVDGTILGRSIIATRGYFQDRIQESLTNALQEAHVEVEALQRVCTTGFGAQCVAISSMTAPETACHARGAFHSFPVAMTLIDIGGRDPKVIRVDGSGQRTESRTVRTCAMGIGSFLDSAARHLDIHPTRLMELAVAAEKAADIGSYCSVLSESEVLERLRDGATREDVALGCIHSVAERVVEIGLCEMGALDVAIFATGGVLEYFPGVVHALADKIGRRITVVPEPITAGALGAALIALDAWRAAGSPAAP